MTLMLKFGDDVLGAVKTISVTRDGEAPHVIETWRVTAAMDAPTPEARESAMATARAFQGATDALKLMRNDVALRTLEVTDCRHGPELSTVRETDKYPADAHGQREVTFTFKGTLQDAETAIQSHRFIITTQTKPGRGRRIVTRGQAVIRNGESPGDHVDDVLPVLGAGYRRVVERVARDANEPSIDYETEDEQVFTPLPGGVDDGHYVVTQSLRDGLAVRATSGFFVGSGAHARALELRPPDDRVLSSRVAVNPFSRRVDFEFQETVDDSDAVTLGESLTFTTTRRVVDHPLLANQNYRQEIGAPQTEVVQEGSAVGVNRHASPPPARFAGDVIERQVRYSVPHPGQTPDKRWVTSWRYVARSTGALGETTPET